MKAASSEGNMSSSDMRMQAFVNTLNQGLVTPAWKMDYATPINNGYPILIWQSNKASGIVGADLRVCPIQVYPNPAKDYLFIQSEQPVEKVEIFDIKGKSVIQLFNYSALEIIDVSGLSNGLYLVRMYVNGIPATKKIVVRK